MKIPTPSFKKIRIVIVIILFLMFFFLIGLVKNSFAAYKGYIDAQGKCHVITNLAMPGTSYSGVTYNFIFSGTIPGYTWTNPTVSSGSGLGLKHFSFYDYWWDESNHSWRQHAAFVNKMTHGETGYQWLIENIQPYNQTVEAATHWPDGPPPECKDPVCETERAAKITECGGEQYVDWTTWNDETCTGGECNIPCENEKQALITQCGGMVNVDWSTFNEETCTGGECKCPTQRELLSQQCGGSEKVDWENFSYATCTGECLPEQCTEEQLDLKVKQMLECDGIRYNWNPSTCRSGNWKPAAAIKATG